MMRILLAGQRTMEVYTVVHFDCRALVEPQFMLPDLELYNSKFTKRIEIFTYGLKNHSTSIVPSY